MVRDFDKKRYIFAAGLTIVIFMLGILLGFVIESKRVDLINSRFRNEKLDYSSLQLQYEYIDHLRADKNCEAVSKTLEENIIQLEKSRIRLENYLRDSNIKKDEFNYLKREYLISQLNYWLLTEKTKRICDLDIVTVIYFYSTKEECPKCEDEAFILTYLKKALGEKILIFSLDSKFLEEPMIQMLIQHYNIREYPSLIINGKPYQGFISKDELLNLICSLYKEDYSICKVK